MNKYQEAINYLWKAYDENKIYGIASRGYLEILQELVEKADSFEWIPVSERLPETINEDSESDYNIFEFDVYIVSVSENSRPILALWDGRCFCDAMYRMLLGVKAWMPLPKPYKEKENDDIR